MAAKAKVTRKKKSVKGKQRTQKSRSAVTGTPKVLDVRSPDAVKQLENLIQKNKVVLVLVYADWCGHCKTFKKDIWNRLAKLPNRKIPLAQVNEKMVSQTPLSNAKIEGYPSVVPIGSDLKPATFKNDNGDVTNAMPNTRDAQMMESLVTQDPEKVLSDIPNSKALTEKAETAADTQVLPSAETVKQSTPEVSADTQYTNPPNLEEDFMSSGTGTTPTTTGQTATPTTTSVSRSATFQGGSLFQDLMNFTKQEGGQLWIGQTRKRRAEARRNTRRN